MIRSREAGTLRAADVGAVVTLAGWVASRRDHGGVIFIDLRDGSGVVQAVLREGTGGELRSEFCLQVIGEVSRRPEGNENPDLSTGDVEITVSSYEILSTSDALPFPLDSHAPDVSEERRLQYRYLDLRRAPVADALKLRSTDHLGGPARDGRPRLPGCRDALSHPFHSGGRPRLPGAGTPAARQLVRASPVTPALQAAADGRRPRALLPVRALLP